MSNKVAGTLNTGAYFVSMIDFAACALFICFVGFCVCVYSLFLRIWINGPVNHLNTNL